MIRAKRRIAKVLRHARWRIAQKPEPHRLGAAIAAQHRPAVVAECAHAVMIDGKHRSIQPPEQFRDRAIVTAQGRW
jgi:hypothetical protein